MNLVFSKFMARPRPRSARMASRLAWTRSGAVLSMRLRLDARRFCSATAPLAGPRATELPLPALGPSATNTDSKRDVTCYTASDMDDGWGLEVPGLFAITLVQ